MGIPNKEQALVLAAAAVGVVIVTSAAFAAEPPVAVVVVEEVVKPEALPKTLPMPEIEEFRAALMRQELRVKNLRMAELEAAKPPEPVSSMRIEPTSEQVLEARYRGRTELLEPQELRELLELTGFEGDALRSAWAIAMRESRGKPGAFNGNLDTGDTSYGLFQINMLGYLGRHRAELYELSEYEELFDPVTNAAVAFQMSSEGTNFGPWCVGGSGYNGCRAGDYKYWLAQFPEEEDANG